MNEKQASARILVVDDNAENRALAQATLEDEGYDVLLAMNGEEAIATFERECPDCILLDVRMPKLDGFAACARIRALPSGADVPIVFLTALRDLDTFESALRAGGDDFLTKPVRPAELSVRVQAALKLRRMGTELREQYDLVRRQRDDLMRLQLQKERLMAFVVHDLKNPVAAIDLHAQLLMRSQKLPELTRDSAQQIRDEVRSLMLLILNLLDISRGEEGRLAPNASKVELRAMIARLTEALTVRARQKQITLIAEVETDELHADPDLMRRVLENLTENAIRYAPSGSTVTIRALRTESAVEIRVADQGSGIPAEMRDKIFERFVQVESEGHDRTGRGLGLAFCKLAVEAHAGRIWIEDGEPGTIFCIGMPHGK